MQYCVFIGKQIIILSLLSVICTIFCVVIVFEKKFCFLFAEDLLKNKWQNVRDTFVKKLKAGLIGRGKYQYEENLMFLHEMYNTKLKLPLHKSSVVKISKKQTNNRVKNVQTSRRNLRNETTVSSQEPALSSGDCEMNISGRNATQRASKRLAFNQNEAVSSEDNFTVVEPSSSAGISYRNTARRASKRLKLNQIEAVSSEGNGLVEEHNSSVGITDRITKTTSQRTSKRLKFNQNEAVSSKKDDTVEEPNLSVGIVDRNTKNTIRRASKRLKSSKNDHAVSLEENYTVEEPYSSSWETDDTSSVEIEKENIGLNIEETVQSQLHKRLQTFQSSRSSNYSHIISFPPQGEVDEDIAFFKTLLTWIKKFDEDEKLEFRYEVMNLIRKIRNHEAIKHFCVTSPLSVRGNP